MTFAQIGPLTTTFEAVATAVGAGVLLGGVTAGIVRLAAGASRTEIEYGALRSGYMGGAVGAAFVLADVVLRYGG